MYQGDEDDELQRLLEGRDLPADIDSHKPKKSSDRPRKKQRVEEEEIEPEREEDDLDDFIVRHPDDPPDSDDDKSHDPDDEAKEAPAKKTAIRRVVRNPQPKLDADRLKSERGLVALIGMNEKISLKGPGHEAEDLDKVMFALEHWGHRLFPKLAFDDLIEKLEQLGSKKQVSVFVKKMRQGLPLDVMKETVESEEEDDIQRGLGIPSPVEATLSAEQAFDIFCAPESASQAAPEPVSLTEEQRQEIARKRLDAIERRKEREAREALERQLQETASSQSQTQQSTDETNDLCSQELMDMIADAEIE